MQMILAWYVIVIAITTSQATLAEAQKTFEHEWLVDRMLQRLILTNQYHKPRETEVKICQN